MVASHRQPLPRSLARCSLPPSAPGARGAGWAAAGVGPGRGALLAAVGRRGHAAARGPVWDRPCRREPGTLGPRARMRPCQSPRSASSLRPYLSTSLAHPFLAHTHTGFRTSLRCLGFHLSAISLPFAFSLPLPPPRSSSLPSSLFLLSSAIPATLSRGETPDPPFRTAQPENDCRGCQAGVWLRAPDFPVFPLAFGLLSFHSRR